MKNINPGAYYRNFTVGQDTQARQVTQVGQDTQARQVTEVSQDTKASQDTQAIQNTQVGQDTEASQVLKQAKYLGTLEERLQESRYRYTIGIIYEVPTAF